MRGFLLVAAVTCVANVFAIADADWMVKARSGIEEGVFFDADETEDDGLYCLVVVQASSSGSSTSNEDREEDAKLTAQRKISAYVNGETMSAQRFVESRSATSDGATSRSKKFSSRIEAKSEAFLRGVRVVGHLSKGEATYYVCVTTEKYKSAAAELAKAQAASGGANVVKGIGVAATREEALAKAKQAAIEQVLGSVVVGRAKRETGKAFENKATAGTDGMVEEYRILSEEQMADGVKIVISAKVARENPFNRNVFLVEGPRANTVKRVSEILSEAGIRVTRDPTMANFVVRCTEEFEEVSHPAVPDRKGTRVNFGVRVENMKTGEVFLSVENADAKPCFVGNAARQKEKASAAALKGLEEELNGKLQDMIARIVRRTAKQ